MIYIYNHFTDPYFNLAAEEYVLKNFTEDCFMLWRNSPCIVIGKNQNTLSEINMDYVEKNKIIVVRRLSGGGSVFHDLGNLNFTFTSNNAEDTLLNFRKFTLPIIDALKELSVKAEFTGRNDLTIDGMKFSGNAQYHHKNKVLHHGTLLFSSDISDLSNALKVNPNKFKDKSVKSVTSRVTNISKHLTSPLSILEFKDLVMAHIMSIYGNENIYSFTEEDIKNIETLRNEKYATWEWNFGKFPKYSFRNEKRFSAGSVDLNMNVNKGLISEIKFFGDFFSKYDISHIENALIGVYHSKEHIKKELLKFNLNNYFFNISLDELIEIFV